MPGSARSHLGDGGVFGAVTEGEILESMDGGGVGGTGLPLWSGSEEDILGPEVTTETEDGRPLTGRAAHGRQSLYPTFGDKLLGVGDEEGLGEESEAEVGEDGATDPRRERRRQMRVRPAYHYELPTISQLLQANCPEHFLPPAVSTTPRK